MFSEKEFEDLLFQTVEAYGSIFISNLARKLDESNISLKIDRIVPLYPDTLFSDAPRKDDSMNSSILVACIAFICVLSFFVGGIGRS